MNGILLVDKPVGISSQNAISVIKRALNINKIGHAGTLDPLASGVLVVLLNDATKLSDYLLEKEKTYLAEITIGKTTDTLDSEGEVTAEKEVDVLLDVDSALESMIGKYLQTPPMYSAIKKNGKKLYELAREGQVIEREKREVEIFEIKRTSEVILENKTLKFSFLTRASKGTYIRSLCDDIGKKLEFPAYMSNLRRVSSGNFNIDECFTLESIKNGEYKVVSMLDAISFLKRVEVNEKLLKMALNGREIDAKVLNASDKKIALANNGNLIAIYEKQENIYKALRVWN